MPDALPACCEKELRTQIKRIARAYSSFPVIKNVPCPTCRRIIPIRVYEKPTEGAPA